MVNVNTNVSSITLSSKAANRLSNKMDIVCQTQNGTDVLIAKTKDKGILKEGYKIIAINEDGYFTSPVYLSRSAVTMENAGIVPASLKGLVDFADLDMSVVTAIMESIIDKKVNKVVDMTEKLNFKEVCEVFVNIYRRTVKGIALDEHKADNFVIEGNYILVRADTQFAKIANDCEWMSLELKKQFKENGMMDVSAGRQYDYGCKLTKFEDEIPEEEKGKTVWAIKIDIDMLYDMADMQQP